jgi:hypothetical protein
MKRVVKVLVATVLIGIILTSTASATIYGTVNIQDFNNNSSDIGTIGGTGLFNLTGLTQVTCYTGIYSWKNEGYTGLGKYVPDSGFCVELVIGAPSGWYDVISLDDASNGPMGTTKANYIRELWGRDYNPDWIINPTTTNKQMAEAFGTAIWEILYETDPRPWDVTSGTGFWATGIEQAATANLWLSQLNGDTSYFANNLVAIHYEGTTTGQDYTVLIPMPPGVPEPATIGLLGLGAVVLFGNRKKPKR